jgi:hypothetical protein
MLLWSSASRYVPGSLEPPADASVGDERKQGVISYRHEGEVAEIPARHEIPRTLARQAVRHFCKTGELSKAVRWEID